VGEEVKPKAPAVASFGTAVYRDEHKVLFHGGYKIWDAGSEFEDLSATHAFDMHAGDFTCLTSGEEEDEQAALGKGKGICPRLGGAHTGKRDEEVAVITSKPIELPVPTSHHEHEEAALGKHLSTAELPALEVEDEEEAESEGPTLGAGEKQHALIIFGGRDEDDNRLDSLYALGLTDKKWRKIEYDGPDERDDMVPQGPFEMPLIVKNEHANGKLFPLGRSAASAVITKDNKMVIYGGFVVEGRLGFNVGETLVLDLNKMKFNYPMVSGNIPVRRNKHTAVLDDKDRMWIWGGSVWDHTGGSSTYASTATYYADLGDMENIVWHRAETKGKPPSQRRFHTAIIMDGGMYIIGGEDYRTRTYLSDVHRLDLTTHTWTQPAVMGGIEGGRIRASTFPWVPKPIHLESVDKGETAVEEAALGSHHHHSTDEEVEEEHESEEKEETYKPIVDVSTCGKGEQARVRTGENQPDIEHLINVLVDGSTLGSNHSHKHHTDDTETAATLAASLASNGWLPNTARGASILSESSMVWRKIPSIGKDENIPGWISDEDSRDKSILTETLAADPEADSVEARLIEAVRASGAVKLKSSKSSEKSSTSSKHSAKAEEEDTVKSTSQKHSTSSNHDDDGPHTSSKSQSDSSGHDDDDDDAANQKTSHSHSKDDDDEDVSSQKHSSHNSDDDDEQETHSSTHHHTHDDGDDDEESSSSHSPHSTHNDEEEPHEEKLHLSAAAKMLQLIQSQGNPEAKLGRVADDSSERTTSHSHVLSGLTIFTLAGVVYVMKVRQPKRMRDDSFERIPLVASRSSTSDSPNKSATWQKEAMARRGIHYASDFEEVI
jgi:regulator of Ty1 transposition protein 103